MSDGNLMIYATAADSLKALAKLVRKDLGEMDPDRIISVSHSARGVTAEGKDYSVLIVYKEQA